MLLSDLCLAAADVAATPSRLEKRARLATLFEGHAANDLALAVTYLTGELPQGRIGVGPSLIHQALADVESGEQTPQAALTLSDVGQQFDAIAAVRGSGAVKRRRELLADLFARAGSGGSEFLARLLYGELRHGALEALLLEAIADATGIEIELVRRAAMLTADPARVASIAVASGVKGLEAIRLTPLAPVRPMLAQPAADLESAFAAVPRAVVDLKLDGARVQIHKDGDTIRVFSRQLNDVTAAVPDVAGRVRELPVADCILDGEVLLLREDGRPEPFQTTMRRFGRKRPDAATLKERPLTLFLFDCLHAAGEPLIDRPLTERLAALAGFAPAELSVPRLVTDEAEEAARFFHKALADGHEGIMVKQPDSLYAAGSRGAAWLKIKHAHTLDLVVLAAEWGSGRRKGWLSNLHLGARDGDDFVMLGKTFKGLTDKLLRWQTKALLERETRRDDYTVYVRPELVVEIAVNEIQESPHYPAGMALRFARVRRYRDDKSALEADTIDTVRQLHNQHTA